MTIFKRIISWGKERGVFKDPFSLKKEISFVLEEALESTGKHDSISARVKVNELLKHFDIDENTEKEIVVDAFGDIIVYATGTIAKLGYDPDKVLDEVLKEIDSRTGKMVDGKFVKDLGVKTYKADFSKCEENL